MTDALANPYPRSGPARGLIRVVHKFGATCRGRALSGNAGAAPRGTCRWCRQPCAPRSNWHDECVRWYLVAKGATVYAGGILPLTMGRRDAERWWAATREWARGDRASPQPGPINCERCAAGGSEIDHALALSVARELRERGDRRWWRAWAPANLRWLCHECHAAKTANDRRELARLRAAQPDLFAA